jgi:hypothetical protein
MGPPQSLSVSEPFLMLSMQVAVHDPVAFTMRGPPVALPAGPSPQMLVAVTRNQKNPPAEGV